MRRQRLATRNLKGLAWTVLRSTRLAIRQRIEAGQLARSPIFDDAFYGAQAGLSFASRRDAAQHFVHTGAIRTHSPHPLLSPAYISPKVWGDWAGRGGVRALLNWVESPRAEVTSWSAFFDPRALDLESRSAGLTPLDFLASLANESELPHVAPSGHRITWGDARAWSITAANELADVFAAVAESTPEDTGTEEAPEDDQRLSATLYEGLVNWDRVTDGLADRVPGRVSIVMPTYQDARMTLKAVSSIVQHSAHHDVEIIVVDNGSSPHFSLALASVIPTLGRTKWIRLDRNYNFAIGSNFGAANSSGEFVLFLNNDTIVRANWLDPLLETISSPEVLGVQPTLIYPDGTIQSAGTRFVTADYLPCTPLAGHPVEDSAAVASTAFSVVTAAALLMRASDVCALKGFDPIFVNGSEDIDLCLRAATLREGHFAVDPRSIVEHHESRTPGRGLRIRENRKILMNRWRGRLPAEATPELDRLDLEIIGTYPDSAYHPAAVPIVGRKTDRARRSSENQMSLRWSIKNPAPGGAGGERWGDTHFIQDLAEALQRLDQQVVSYRFGSHESPHTALDDVNLVIRGLRRVAPHPGQVNILWIISHPEDVTRDELFGYDLVYAASTSWAQWATTEWNTPVMPLLQATDTSVFHPSSTVVDADLGVVFVGQTRPDGPRKIVMDAIEAGIDVKVWGERWERYIPKKYVQGEYVPNHQLPDLYRRASLVLSDHHSAMAERGFVANRLFDAVASGARVVSDQVDGLDELFKGCARTYRSIDELAAIAAAVLEPGSFPGRSERDQVAAHVALNHSFDARAQRILADVRAITGQTP